MAADAHPEPEHGFARSPLAVVVDDQAWTRRSLEQILGGAGYRVRTAVDAKQALDVVPRADADVLLVHLDLARAGGPALIGELSDRAFVDVSTPIIAFSRERTTREVRLEALRRGAWYVLDLPFDADELLLRLRPMVRAKQRASDLRKASLVDAVTGLYNEHGVLRRLSELRAAASRGARPLACVVVGPRGESPPPRLAEAKGESVGRIHRATRRSDAKGALAPDLYVVVAPDTDVTGARILAQRILADSGEPSADWVAGLFAEADLEASSTTAPDYLSRATEAFRRAQVAEASSRIMDYARELA
ncbi:MAG: response regulator [Gemmatimonadetes bacterium]|nr:response regulator [Gemmatimonadota bacterium]NNK63137.1 response regulator [Gemmatimonadota bacterium]